MHPAEDWTVCVSLPGTLTPTLWKLCYQTLRRRRFFSFIAVLTSKKTAFLPSRTIYPRAHDVNKTSNQRHEVASTFIRRGLDVMCPLSMRISSKWHQWKCPWAMIHRYACTEIKKKMCVWTAKNRATMRSLIRHCLHHVFFIGSVWIPVNITLIRTCLTSLSLEATLKANIEHKAQVLSIDSSLWLSDSLTLSLSVSRLKKKKSHLW